MITKRDLLEMLADYPDDIKIQVALPSGENGDQIDIIGGTFVSGYGRVIEGQRAFLLEILPSDVSEIEEQIEDDPELVGGRIFLDGDDVEPLICPHCGKEIEEV